MAVKTIRLTAIRLNRLNASTWAPAPAPLTSAAA
jgi:hypothetical protein